jgi:hypothetical protein
MKKFFIVGCPRSGTTMVQQALNRHSQVAIPPETKYFFSFLGHSQQHQAQHIDRLNEDLRIQLAKPATAVRTADQARAFYEEMASQYVRGLGKKGIRHFGEKSPEHTGHLSSIRQLYPDAKLVVLYRDGRDVALSLTKTPWMPAGLYVNFLVWLYYYQAIQQAKNSGFSNLYFARYEDIVANPDKELRGILNFLGLPYERAVAEEHGNKQGIPEREFAWKGKALERITSDRVGVSQRELAREQLGALEGLGGHALSSLGYSLTTDGKTPLSAPFLLQLACDCARLFSRLPWHSVVRELAVRDLLPEANAPGLLQRFGRYVRDKVNKILSWIPAPAEPEFRAFTHDATSRAFPVRLAAAPSGYRVPATLEK